MSTAELRAAPVAERAARKRRLWPWLLAGGAFMIVIAPVVLFAGAGNPPCQAVPTATGTTNGSAPSGMFAQPLQLQPDHWYRVGATEYGGPGDPTSGAWGASGAYLPSVPDSFAELSVLETNPANTGTFTFQDANALNILPYGTALRVAVGDRQRVLYKRDVGYGQGPGQAIPYRIDVWWQSAAALGISKTPVAIELAPSSGAGALLGELPVGASTGSDPSSSAGSCPAADGGPLPLTPGQQAKILPNGLAAAPADAPAAVRRAIAAGNQLITKPYVYGGGHGQPLTELGSGYDCSGATSYILHGAGVFGLYAEDSTGLESFGQPGPGAWITVYANSGHAFIDVAGVVMNTAWYAPVEPTTPSSGPRWQPASTIPAQYAGDQYGGFVQRHPQGL
jgi:hypothetical protein